MKTPVEDSHHPYLYAAYRTIEDLEMKETKNIAASMGKDFYFIDSAKGQAYFVRKGTEDYNEVVALGLPFYSISEIIQLYCN